MANYTGPVCRLCRREGVKLYLKGAKCVSNCTFDKRNALHDALIARIGER